MIWSVAVPATKSQINKLREFEKITAQLLWQKGLRTKAEADAFFNPRLEQISDYYTLAHSANAAKLILESISKQKQIYIYGDYDVDGVCATSILFDFLYRKLGAKVLPYIPSRFDEGYGISRQGLEAILAGGGELVITVDCGIRDRLLINEYAAKGLQFIVTDHHQLPEDGKIPEQAVCVHPSLPGYQAPFQEICATAVAWKLIRALAAEAVKQKLLSKKISENEYLDLVALATVCDVMPLVAENRAMVALGLQKMRQDPNPGLAELMRITGVEKSELTSFHLGYVLGPRINAGGRIKHALEGVRLLTSSSKTQIEKSANKLECLNAYRQQLTIETLEQAESQVRVNDKTRMLFVYGSEWQEGIIGLVAGKLSEKYYLPTFVASVKAKQVKGSARSIKALNITQAIAQSSHLLIKFGGHHQAAGFTLKEENLQEFSNSLNAFIVEQIAETDLVKTIHVSLEAQPEDITLELAKSLGRFEPFGYANQEPVFMIRKLQVVKVGKVGKMSQHLKLTLKDKSGKCLEAIGFGLSDGFYEKIETGATIHIVGYLSVNKWNGCEKLQIKLKDIKFDEADIIKDKTG